MTDTLKSEWLDAARPELDRLTGDNAELKAHTILSLVTAEALNIPMTWGQGSGNCARSTWKDRWRKEPLTAEVYQNVRALILEARQASTIEAVTEAQDIIQKAAPRAARTLVALLTSANEMTRRLAAESILDRASQLTAVKQDNAGLNADKLADLARQARQELTAWETRQEAAAVDTAVDGEPAAA